MRPTLLIVLAVSALISCQKDPEIVPEPDLEALVIDTDIPIAEFTQLKTGNYWIYARYVVDSNGVETCLNITDSMYIPGDTTINGKLYSIVKRTTWIGKTQYLRDSSNYLVNHMGDILFSSTDFSNILLIKEDTNIFTINYQMTDQGLVINTPAGDFSTFNYQATIDLKPGWDMWGTPRYTNQYRAAGVGVVKDSFITTGSPNTNEIRLVKYNLN